MKLKFPNQDEDNFINSLKKRLEEFKLPSFNDVNFSGELSNTFEKISGQFTIKKAVGLIVALVFMVIGIFAFTASDSSEKSSKEVRKVNFKIKEGMDAGEIARRLEREGIIESGLKFRILAKIEGYEDKLKVGNYNLSTGMSYDDLFKKLLAGAPEIVRFTIPEGFTVKDIAKRLANNGLVNEDDFLRKAERFAPYGYITPNSNVFYDCEGFLFPDTYEVEDTVEAEDILMMMVEDFDYRLTSSMRSRAAEEGLSIYELITLASIVEKEVRFAEDRPIVAQVFFKRLKVGMPLQTDASLQYLMDAPKEDVSIADTQIDSPYNTYQHGGLPPGPIANPGLDAIEAVLNPANTDYLYFVADRNGHNHYAYTYDEHLTLVNQYR
ncbi:MAG: endolytic transglycosylase MltG [Selenomonadaceae bacterium]|nr:endolytic transglycosylase MltG [Selenomonadaceae bacterium]